jgi:hypothetical protein
MYIIFLNKIFEIEIEIYMTMFKRTKNLQRTGELPDINNANVIGDVHLRVDVLRPIHDLRWEMPLVNWVVNFGTSNAFP